MQHKVKKSIAQTRVFASGSIVFLPYISPIFSSVEPSGSYANFL